MKPLVLVIVGTLLAGCRSGPASGEGSAVVHGMAAGQNVVATDVVGLLGTQSADGGASSFAGVLISSAAGTCAMARQSGVRAATSNANVLEIVATAQGASLAPGTYTVGDTGLAEYFYIGQNGDTSGTAGGGSITFDTVSPSTLSGSFDVTLAGGNHLTGTFSGPVCSGIPAKPYPW
jgi:hypothetical protein